MFTPLLPPFSPPFLLTHTFSPSFSHHYSLFSPSSLPLVSPTPKPSPSSLLFISMTLTQLLPCKSHSTNLSTLTSCAPPSCSHSLPPTPNPLLILPHIPCYSHKYTMGRMSLISTHKLLVLHWAICSSALLFPASHCADL